MSELKVLQMGAEALILKEKDGVIKRRIKKSYRISELDEKIRKLRTRSEGKLLDRVSKLIDTPKIKKVDEKNKEILMDFVDGKRLSNSLDDFSINKQKEICSRIGENVAKLHGSNIIHGDLTTSNMIYVEQKYTRSPVRSQINNIVNNKTYNNSNFNKDSFIKNSSGQERENVLNQNNFKIFFIDFGLGFISHKIEDKAVDLHLFKEALEARHFKNWEVLFKEFLRGYEEYPEHKKVLEQLRKVEKRGRYKERY